MIFVVGFPQGFRTKSLKPFRFLASQVAPIDQRRQKKKSGTKLGTNLGGWPKWDKSGGVYNFQPSKK